MKETKNKVWKAIRCDEETHSMLSLMAKACNAKKSSFLRELVTEIFNTFIVYKPVGVQIFYEASLYPEVYVKLTFTGKRALIVGKTSEEAITETLLKIEGEKQDD